MGGGGSGGGGEEGVGVEEGNILSRVIVVTQLNNN